MSFRPRVDRQRIDGFLRQLGHAFREPARLYLVGGTTLVYEGFRRTTLDINFAVELDPAHHGEFMRRIAELKDRLAVNVEEVSPGDFIPLPSGWRDRARYVGRFDQMDVFHFDLVSTALAKISRGFEEDIADVRALLAAGHFSAEDLRAGFQEVAARLPERGWSEREIEEFAAGLERTVEGV